MPTSYVALPLFVTESPSHPVRSTVSWSICHLENPVEDPGLLDGQEAVHGPGQVVLILEVAESRRDNLGWMWTA